MVTWLLPARAETIPARACLHAALSRLPLAPSHVYVALRLNQFFLVGLQRARGRVSVRLGRVVLLLGNFAFFHKWQIARQVRFGQFRISADSYQCWLGRTPSLQSSLARTWFPRDPRRPRRRANCASALEFPLLTSSRVRGNIRAADWRVALRHIQSGLGLIERRLVVARVNLQQHLSRPYRLVSVTRTSATRPEIFAAIGVNMPIHLRVIGASRLR